MKFWSEAVDFEIRAVRELRKEEQFVGKLFVTDELLKVYRGQVPNVHKLVFQLCS
jgi:hypothetical protein